MQIDRFSRTRGWYVVCRVAITGIFCTSALANETVAPPKDPSGVWSQLEAQPIHNTNQLVTFTRLVTGAIVNDGGWSFGHAWGDVDNDGCLDLLVCNLTLGQANFFYRNNCDGTFARITNSPVVANGPTTSASWGDYDNDGNVDVFLANGGTSGSAPDALFRNLGAGNFNAISAGALTTDNVSSTATSWVDLDNDGRLDLFVGRSGGPNRLFHQQQDGTFTGVGLPDGGGTWGVSWSDYDHDGDMDCFAANWGIANYLYRNDDGLLVRVHNTPMTLGSNRSVSGSWGDYDNDGDPDLFVANSSARDRLFRNDAGGVFTEITSAPMTLGIANSESSCWGDFDHDGDLDLVVSAGGNVTFGRNKLYENFGDGTFAAINSGELTSLSGRYEGLSCIDYDNDGDLDLFISNYNNLNNLFFRNNLRTPGNAGSKARIDNWLSVKCIGSQSNRSAIGTTVRVKANLGSGAIWQMREITAHTGHVAQGDPRAHFGLGAATSIDSLVVEWPSRHVDVLTNLVANLFLEIRENQAPTAIEVEAFRGTLLNDIVRLSWRLSRDAAQTVSEVRIQRSTAAKGPWVTRANLSPGLRMEFEDRVDDAEKPSVLWYRIMFIEPNGRATFTQALAVGSSAANQPTLEVESTGRSVLIHYSLPRNLPIHLDIFDVAGRRTRRLRNGSWPTGTYLIHWDGQGISGQPVARGVYFVRLVADDRILSRRVVVVGP